jgi:demethoxyubiquinone hydroxylase (CLK1/Coq7/Cat5 family)
MLARRMASSGMLRRVAIVRTDVSEELSATIIRVTRIGELGTLAVTSNQRTRISSQSASVASYA